MEKKSVVFEDADIIKRLYRIGAIAEITEKVELHPILAEYLAEKQAIPKGKYLAMVKSDKLAKDKLTVIQHLWSKGYASRFSLEGDDYSRVYRKGVRPGDDRTLYLLKVIPKNWKTSLEDLLAHIEISSKLRKELVFVFVTGEKIQFLGLSRRTFE